jgi:hypothetical protein
MRLPSRIGFKVYAWLAVLGLRSNQVLPGLSKAISHPGL